MSGTATSSAIDWQKVSKRMWKDIKKAVYKPPQTSPSQDKTDTTQPIKLPAHFNDVNDTSQPTKSPLQDKSNIIKPKSIPRMVFSVIGDSVSFFPRPWPKAVFQTALIEAAKGGGETWILYRGNDYEVSKLVENAYQHYENLEFGIERVDIGDPRRHIKLINISGKEDEKDRKSKTREDSPTIYYTKQSESDTWLPYFEQFVSEQKLKYFEEYFEINVPIAIIACEGDFKTIKKIAAALEKKIPVIIMKGSGKAADLVLDYLQNPDAFQKQASILFGIALKEDEIDGMKKDLKQISEYKDLVAIFDLHRDDPLMLSSIVGEAIVSCMSIENISPKEKNEAIKSETLPEGESKSVSMEMELPIGDRIKITAELKKNGGNGVVIRKKSTQRQTMGERFRYSLKNSILAKIPKASKGVNEPESRELREKLKWKTKTYILSPEFCSATSLPLYFFFGYKILQECNIMERCGDVLLFEALKANRCDYVKVLLDQGVEFKLSNLNDLYIETISCLDCKSNQNECKHMQWILKKLPKARQLHAHLTKQVKNNGQNVTQNENDTTNSTKYVAERMCQKILRYEGKAASGNSTKTGYHEKCLPGLCSQCRVSNKVNPSKDEKDEEKQKEIPKDEGIADLLLWAIFVDRKEMAEICWLRGDDHLFIGMVCSAILKKLSKDADKVKEHVLSEHLEEHSKIFEQRCIKILDRMLEESEERVLNLLDSETSVWGIQSSPLTFAYENFMYDVIAHTCSQKHMNDKWYNGLPPGKCAYLKCIRTQPINFITSTKTKYLINSFMFLSVLVTYSAFVLTSVGTKYYSQFTARAMEYYVYIWSFGDSTEEIMGCIDCEKKEGRSHRGYKSRMTRHLNDFWNCVDLLSYIFLMVALIVRHSYEDETHVTARNLFAFSLLVTYLRFLEVFLIFRVVGPKLMMIKEMLKDLFIFLIIAVFVILGVGIYYHANLWPDHRAMWNGGFSNWRIWKIIYYPYWQLYGEFNLDVLDGSDNSDCNVTSIWESDMSTNRCPHEDWTVQFIAAIFVLFSNLLLVNLVIAMFSYTFERVQNVSEKLWHFQRYTVITDYSHRIPSPFNLILRPIVRICFSKDPSTDKDKEQKEKLALRSFQKIIALRCYNKN